MCESGRSGHLGTLPSSHGEPPLGFALALARTPTRGQGPLGPREQGEQEQGEQLEQPARVPGERQRNGSGGGARRRQRAWPCCSRGALAGKDPAHRGGRGGPSESRRQAGAAVGGRAPTSPRTALTLLRGSASRLCLAALLLALRTALLSRCSRVALVGVRGSFSSAWSDGTSSCVHFTEAPAEGSRCCGGSRCSKCRC